MATRPKTGGRKKGVPNKLSGDLKACILEAARLAGDEVEPNGGVTAYLKHQAGCNPHVFVPLLGKVLPMTVASDKDNPVTFQFVTCYEKKPE